MDNDKRALRRHHATRIKRKTEHQIRNSWTLTPNEEDLQQIVNQRWQHRHMCSCSMCGNPRRHEKGQARLTMQERRADLG